MKAYREAVTVVSELEFRRCIEVHGVLVTPFQAAYRSSVDRSRIYQLIEDGTFRKFVVFGQVHIADAEFCDWQSKREGGGK